MKNLNEKHAGLAQQNGFGPAFWHTMLRLVKGTAKLLTPAVEYFG
jgi:hypothetical protein